MLQLVSLQKFRKDLLMISSLRNQKRRSRLRKLNQLLNHHNNINPKWPHLHLLQKDNKLPQMAPMSTNNSVPKTAPTCINCKTNESKAWRWNESDEEFKRGLFCNNCYIYLIDKGVMRPSYLFKKRSKGKKKTSAPTTTNSSSAVSTPSGSKMVVNQTIHENQTILLIQLMNLMILLAVI